jgi:hypothetical protein
VATAMQAKSPSVTTRVVCHNHIQNMTRIPYITWVDRGTTASPG